MRTHHLNIYAAFDAVSLVYGDKYNDVTIIYAYCLKGDQRMIICIIYIILLHLSSTVASAMDAARVVMRISR